MGLSTGSVDELKSITSFSSSMVTFVTVCAPLVSSSGISGSGVISPVATVALEKGSGFMLGKVDSPSGREGAGCLETAGMMGSWEPGACTVWSAVEKIITFQYQFVNKVKPGE